jgi:Transposase DDE domain
VTGRSVVFHFVLLDCGSPWANRLVESSRGWQLRAGCFWGQDGTESHKLGGKRHLICDGRGVPLVIQLTGANRNDSQQALALVEAIPALAGKAMAGIRQKKIRPTNAVYRMSRTVNIGFTFLTHEHVQTEQWGIILFPTDEMSPKSIVLDRISLRVFCGSLHHGRLANQQIATYGRLIDLREGPFQNEAGKA